MLEKEQNFLRDVLSHVMTVISDDGKMNRHIRFSKPSTRDMQFDLITWPGHLCYTGDMGTYVFERTPDMFEFFRTDRLQRDDGRTLKINRQYWAEKCIAADRDGIEVYSADKFTQRINEWLDDLEADDDMREDVKNEVLYHAEDNEWVAMRAAIDYTYNERYPFQDFGEVNCREWTPRYEWCCFALAWGIQQYDNHQNTAIQPQDTRKATA